MRVTLKSKVTKSGQLGIDAGTASHRLKKIVLFNLVQETGRDICYRCSNKILIVEDLSIDHKIPWLHNGVDLFWDVNNIAFSHLSCNSSSTRMGLRARETQDNKFRCSSRNNWLEAELFHKRSAVASRLSSQCKKCRSARHILQKI